MQNSDNKHMMIFFTFSPLILIYGHGQWYMQSYTSHKYINMHS